MHTEPSDSEESKPLVVRRGRVQSVDLYEIKDTELDLLEKGSPADLQLNFAIFLLSLAANAICTLATAAIANNTVKTFFMIGAVVGVLGGLYLLIAWWRNRVSLKSLCARIRSRIPPEPQVILASQTGPSESPKNDE